MKRLWSFYPGKRRGQPRRDQGGGAAGGAGSGPLGARCGRGRRACAPLFASAPLDEAPFGETPFGAVPFGETPLCLGAPWAGVV